MNAHDIQQVLYTNWASVCPFIRSWYTIKHGRCMHGFLWLQRQAPSFNGSTLFHQAQVVPQNLSQHFAPRNHTRDVLGIRNQSKILSSANIFLVVWVKALWCLHFPLTVLLPHASFRLRFAAPKVPTMSHPSQAFCTWRSPGTQSPWCCESSSWWRVHYEDKVIGVDGHLNGSLRLLLQPNTFLVACPLRPRPSCCPEECSCGASLCEGHITTLSANYPLEERGQRPGQYLPP